MSTSHFCFSLDRARLSKLAVSFASHEAIGWPFYFLTIPSKASRPLLPLILLLKPPLLRLSVRLSFFSSGVAPKEVDEEPSKPLLLPIALLGSDESESPFASRAPVAEICWPCCAGELSVALGLRPSLSSVLYSRYNLAAGERGIGAGSTGMLAPFCRRSSAIANGLRGEVAGSVVADAVIVLLAVIVRIDAVEDDEVCEAPPPIIDPGAAGSAATRAR
jgi:hypothetical protein